MPIEYITLLMSTLFFAIGISMAGYFIYRDAKIRKNQFELQMQSLMSQKALKDQLSFKDLYSIIDDYIKFVSTSSIVSLGLSELTSEELSVQLPEILSSVCTEIEVSLPDVLKEQIYLYSTHEYLKKYILTNTKNLIILVVDKYKRNGANG